uniref:ATS domain-containing protein n=1 Tax=Strongyloides venezuelensis TaxID=75913 RepID=A0A0K0FSM4_STRVS
MDNIEIPKRKFRADTIFKELCVERRNFIIDFISKRNETDKFLRHYLKIKNIINLIYNNKEHQYVYEMKFCRKVNVIEKIINDGYEENICYTRVPVVTEDKEIRFADDDNYLYYETKTINCQSKIKINQSIELNDTIIEDT